MRKILKIARYDFKRLMFNPITVIVMTFILIFCFIFGLVYKIPNAPTYCAETSGQTTSEIFLNFREGTYDDSKAKLEANLVKVDEILDIQSSSVCSEHDNLKIIASKFEIIKDNIEKYDRSGSCIYLERGTLDISSSDGQSIVEASNLLSTFVTEYESLDEFESRLLFKTQDFETLKNLDTFFKYIISKNTSVKNKLDSLVTYKSKFNDLKNVTNSAFLWSVTSQEINTLKIDIILKAETKNANIFNEMRAIYDEVNQYDMQRADDMKSLITNFKLTSESAVFAVIGELELLLNKHPSKLFGYESIETENSKNSLLKATHFLQDENLYYTQYQEALNFNIASYETTAFDHSYMIMSIIGFMTILFGIFCAYKLFGRDRRNGKMDLILSQNVTFNQVFAGKFMAIVMSTSFVLAVYSAVTLVWGLIMFGTLPNTILAVFNLSTTYTISPFLFWLIKIVGIELQVLFYSIITVFLMNLSRKFDFMFLLSLLIFITATICNIFLNGQLWYCMLPFIHADVTSFLGGATMESGFLRTSLYTNGNFFISLVYYIVILSLVYNFTKQLFKKN